MAKLISTDLSQPVLNFERGHDPVSFTLTVYNDSYKDAPGQFASFQLNLLAAGGTQNLSSNWYRLVPAVSYKIPPGDSTQFQIEILDVPPVTERFTGTMNLTVRVYSPELRDEVRRDVRLVVKGEGLSPPEVSLPQQHFQAVPRATVEIVASLHNPNRKAVDCAIQLKGPDDSWFPEGTHRSALLDPGQEQTVKFVCKIPEPGQAPNQVYPLTFEILRPVEQLASQQATLTVTPAGAVEFACDPLEYWLPEKPNRWLNPRQQIATFDLTFDNNSNLSLTSAAEVKLLSKLGLLARLRRLRPSEETTTEDMSLPAGATLTPAQVSLAAGKTERMALTLERQLPWLGWPRLERIAVKRVLTGSEHVATLTESVDAATTEPATDTQIIELGRLPVVPVWLQTLLGAVLLSVLGFWVWKLTHQGHTAPVNSVQFSGRGNEVISASDDQTVRRWRVQGNRLAAAGVVTTSDKAVRVVKYRPVNNDEIVAGFENGTLSIDNLLSQRSGVFDFASDDRVFDLALSRDARSLFSAHGSGLVLQWLADPSRRLNRQTEPLRKIETDFAVSAIALLGEADTQLAIAGRYNQLVVVNLATEEANPFPYDPGGQTDYILSLATAEAQPARLATADSQGNLAIWDVEQCLQSLISCEPIDQWLGHGGAAVRSVALSQDGCYLASGGDNAQVRLWPLTTAGSRQPQTIEGEILRHGSGSINAVDIIQHQNRLQVVSGGDDTRVRLDTVRQVSSNNRPPGQCPSPGGNP